MFRLARLIKMRFDLISQASHHWQNSHLLIVYYQCTAAYKESLRQNNPKNYGFFARGRRLCRYQAQFHSELDKLSRGLSSDHPHDFIFMRLCGYGRDPQFGRDYFHCASLRDQAQHVTLATRKFESVIRG